jgi:hypothetical protein
MSPALLAAYVLGNVSLFLYPQEFVPDIQWPTHAVVTLPQGWLKPGEQLFLLENDQPTVAQIETVARWPDGSPKWLHVHASYRYAAGKAARYTLARAPQLPDNIPKSPLRVVDDAQGITIDTGAVKLLIARPFAGITLAEFRGHEVLKGPGGPSFVDDRGIAWHAIHDHEAEITIEQNGPAQVTVKASGWYQTAERRVEPFCRFVTRITAFAGSSIVKFDHATIFAGDMRRHAISELAFKFSVPLVNGFSSAALDTSGKSATIRGTLDARVPATWFAQLSADRLVTLNEEPNNPAGLPKIIESHGRSAGWFCALLDDARLALMTKDLWQKCPKEVKIGRDELTYYAWPKHGELSTPDATATRPEGVYKFQCFLTGRLLDSRLPGDYFSALEEQTDTRECKAEYARAANLEGVAIHNEFALALMPPAGEQAKGTDNTIANLQRLYAESPIARVSPTAVASSGVLGPVSASRSEFASVERAVRDGILGYARSIERYGDYGWAIYGNTHHEELMNPAAAGVAGGRPSLHRVWSNNHYQHVSTSWRLFALQGDAKLLDWARIATDNYASIGQVRYDGLRGRVDGEGKHHPGPSRKFHLPGAFFHCKGFVPWGGRDFGMDSNDVDAALTGHWPDPSGLLFAWLFDANRWAKDGYDLWLANVKFPTGSARREINTTLVHAITAHEYQPKAETLAAIKGMARGLTSIPIVEQRPGPIWEPTWLSRYYELLPDDAAFNRYIVESADAVGCGVEGIWSLALSATAYQITKDEKYLRQHAGTLARAVRQVFYDAAPDKRWDKYGFGPGPGRDGHFVLQWHRFSAALKDAKIESLPPPDEPGNYLCGAGRCGFDILIWKETAAATMTVDATALSGGDIHATSMKVLSPKGQAVLEVPRLPMSAAMPQVVRRTRESSWEVAREAYTIPAGEAGLYTLRLVSHQIGVFQPVTSLSECQVVKNSKLAGSPDPCFAWAKLTRGYLVPLARGKIELTFTAMGERDGSYVSLRGPGGEAIVERSLRAGDSVTVALNARGGVPAPWLLDVFSDHSGFFKLSIASDTPEPLLYGRRLEDVQFIRGKLGK